MKRTLLTLLAVIAAVVASSAPVTANQAQAVARQFASRQFASRQGIGHAPAQVTLTLAHEAKATTGQADYYVFNCDGGGYVVVSGDDCTLPVWGYGESGSFDPDCMPDNLRWWLGEYQRQLEWLRQHPAARPRQAVTLSSSVSPLLATQWDQGVPYNNLCPQVSGTSSGRAWTGCVATAMAQIMKYHSWPLQGRGHHSYTWNSPSGPVVLSADFGQSAYAWSQMSNSYSGSYTTAQANAVARLMSDVGIAVDMNYGANGSGAQSYDAYTALRTCFAYSSAMRYMRRDNTYDYSDLGSDWDAVLRSELDAGRPIYYSGSNSKAGHAFVFDGYNTSGYFHINWGWSGASDSYFASSVLDPSQQGAGSSEGGYNMNQTAIIGIEPAAQPEACVVRVGEMTAMADVMPADDVRCYVDLEAAGGDYNGQIAMWVITADYAVMDYVEVTVDIAQGEQRRVEFRASIDADQGEEYYLALRNPYFDSYGYIWGRIPSFTVGAWSTPPDGEEVLATSVSLDSSDATLVVGDSLYLTASVLPENATNRTVAWKSSNPASATVDANGCVRAVKAGAATITATTTDGSNKSATCQVTVTQPVTSITLNKTSATLNVGETLTLRATISPGDATNKAVVWSSSNTAVATVSGGVVTAKGIGTATINVSTQDGSNLSASCAVTVVKPASAKTHVTAPDFTVTKSQKPYVVPLTLELDDEAADFTNIEVHLTIPDGLDVALVTTDDNGNYILADGDSTNPDNFFVEAGSDIKTSGRPPRPVVNFTTNFDEPNIWPYNYNIVGANISQTPNTANPSHFVTFFVKTTDGFTPGVRPISTYVKYTTSNNLSFTFGDPVAREPICQVTFAETTDDVNGDGRVDLDDINAVVNLILELTTRYADTADVNGDGIVNVFDLNQIIDSILAQ